MKYISSLEIESLHRKKRSEILKEMSTNIDPILYLNTALLDNSNDALDIKTKSEVVEFQNKKYKLVNAADSIQNKSRLKIIYLLSFLETPDKTGILIELANKLTAKGHDVLIYSHYAKPTGIVCSAYYLPVHHDSNLCDVIAGGDIVVAGCWHMAADAIKVSAPLKYIFVHEDSDILEFDMLNEDTKKAVSTAFSLPFRILTTSNKTEQLLKQYFARESIVIENAINIKKSNKKTENGKCYTLNTCLKKIEREFNSSSKSTIQAIKTIPV